VFSGCLIAFKLFSVLIHIYSQQFNGLLRRLHCHDVRNDKVTAGLSGKTRIGVKIKATLFNFHIHFNGFYFTNITLKATVLAMEIWVSKIV